MSLGEKGPVNQNKISNNKKSIKHHKRQQNTDERRQKAKEGKLSEIKEQT
jgi:hypothetical protein